MSARSKGRGVPPAPPAPRRLGVPTGDIVLGDGRILRGGALVTMGGPGVAPVIARHWRCDDGMIVIASSDVTPRWGALLHVSLSYRDRDPTWDDIKLVRGAFFPADGDAMMLLPRMADYVSVHDHAFHLWQTPERWGIQ